MQTRPTARSSASARRTAKRSSPQVASRCGRRRRSYAPKSRGWPACASALWARSSLCCSRSQTRRSRHRRARAISPTAFRPPNCSASLSPSGCSKRGTRRAPCSSPSRRSVAPRSRRSSSSPPSGRRTSRRPIDSSQLSSRERRPTLKRKPTPSLCSPPTSSHPSNTSPPTRSRGRA